MGSKKGFMTPLKTVNTIKVKKTLTDLQYEEIFAAVLENSADKSPSQAESSHQLHAAEPCESASVESDLGRKTYCDTSSLSADDFKKKVVSSTQRPSNSELKSKTSSEDSFKKPFTYRDILNILENTQNSTPLSQPDSTESSFTRSFIGNELSQPPRHLRHRDRLEWLQNRRGAGLWVRCDQSVCQKWRFLEISDPVDVPKKWFCKMNTDKNYNDCSIPEKKVPFRIEEDLIHNEYTAGSIVWAKLTGYPWWPAMVDDCPDTEQYYWLDGYSDIPVDYNVTFLDKKEVSRAWIKTNCLLSFKHYPNYDQHFIIPTKFKSKLTLAKHNAEIAIKLSIQERLKIFSFLKRWPHEIHSPLPSEVDSDDSDNTRARKALKKKIYLTNRQSIFSAMISKEKLESNTVNRNKKPWKNDQITAEKQTEPKKIFKRRDSCRLQRSVVCQSYEESSDEDMNEEILVKKITKRRHTISVPKQTEGNMEPLKKIRKRRSTAVVEEKINKRKNDVKTIPKQKRIVKRRSTVAEKSVEPKRLNKRRNTDIYEEKQVEKQPKLSKPVLKKVEKKQTEKPKTPKKRGPKPKVNSKIPENNSPEKSQISIVISSDDEGESNTRINTSNSSPQKGIDSIDSILISSDDSSEDEYDQKQSGKRTKPKAEMEVYTQCLIEGNRIEQSVVDEIIMELQNKKTIDVTFETPKAKSRLSDSFEKLPTITEEEEDNNITKSSKGKKKIGKRKEAETEFKKPNKNIRNQSKDSINKENSKKRKSPVGKVTKKPKKGFNPPLLKSLNGSSSSSPKSIKSSDDKTSMTQAKGPQDPKTNGSNILTETQNLFDEECDVNFDEFKTISQRRTSSQTMHPEPENIEDNLMDLLGSLSPSSIQFELED